jgi:branched-chain amino acid transport system substrate-binding protein
MVYEKLATDDKVDLMLPPWGSAMNFAVAPVATKHGYPLIGPTAISGKFKELALPYFYTLLVQPAPQMQAIAALLKELKAQGRITKVAVAYVNDLFGIELNTATGPAFRAAGLEVVDTKSYPLGTKDLSPVLKSFKAAGADAFVGLTYIRPTISWPPLRPRRWTGTHRCSSPRWALPSPSTATASRAPRGSWASPAGTRR